MAFDNERGRLIILSGRGGSVSEIAAFLHDLENAYNRIFLFQNFALDSYLDPRSRRFRLHAPFWHEVGLPLMTLHRTQLPTDLILPEDQLLLGRVRVESPGLWEFLGSLNPLQQIREYLNDRHRRRQDREYREQSEREKLILENELLRRQIFERENSIWRDQINLLKEMGFSNDEIQSLYWANMGLPLVQLGRHQDTQLISVAE